jgi:hypothetical protein
MDSRHDIQFFLRLLFPNTKFSACALKIVLALSWTGVASQKLAKEYKLF